MMGKSKLMATAALLSAVSFAMPAAAQSRSQTPAATPPAAPVDTVTQAEYDALVDRVKQLEDEKADGNAALATMTTSTGNRLSALEKGWFGNTTVSGRMYWDVTSIASKNGSTKQASTGLGFDIKRFYVGIDHKFSDMFSGNVTTDFQYNSTIGATEVYIKKAYMDAKIFPELDIKVGATDLPWVPFAEGVYGFRQYENTIADALKFGTSSDWGVHVSGVLADGLVQYAVAAVNGNGYKNPTRSKTFDYEGRLSLNYDGLVLGVGGYTGKLGKDVQGGTPTRHTATRFNAIAAYTISDLHFGVEYFSANNWRTVTNASTEKANGYSVFADYKIDPLWSVFGRYDWATDNNPSGTAVISPKLKENYFNIGIQWEPTKIVDIALIYKHQGVKNYSGTISTSNGSIGGTSSLLNTGKYDEIGIFGQWRW